jgi:hypothetical protein
MGPIKYYIGLCGIRTSIDNMSGRPKLKQLTITLQSQLESLHGRFRKPKLQLKFFYMLWSICHLFSSSKVRNFNCLTHFEIYSQSRLSTKTRLLMSSICTAD